MIGHLQRNKVNIYRQGSLYIRYTIAPAGDKQRARQSGKRADVLLQVNVSGEESKFGMDPGRVGEFLEQAIELENVHVRGLMTIAPYTENPEETRPVFARLREIFEKFKAEKLPGVDMDFLSMGMTGDFTVAIEEGANMVRIGTGIFGSRGH